MENFDEADFSPAALFPELDEMQLLGFYTDSRLDLGCTHAAANAMLIRLKNGADYTDGDGFSWSILADACTEDGQHLAWVEWRYRARGRYEDLDYYLKARGSDGKLRLWPLETAYPGFDCGIVSLVWQGETVVLVYTEKHQQHWQVMLGPEGQILNRQQV